MSVERDIHHQRSRTDKRSVRVKLTDKGKAISETVNRLLERQLNMLEKVGGVSVPDLKHFNQISVKLERFWGDQIRTSSSPKAAFADLTIMPLRASPSRRNGGSQSPKIALPSRIIPDRLPFRSLRANGKVTASST